MKYIGISLITFILLAGCASNNTPAVIKKDVKAVNNDTNTTVVPPKPKKDIKTENKPPEHDKTEHETHQEETVNKNIHWLAL